MVVRQLVSVLPQLSHPSAGHFTSASASPVQGNSTSHCIWLEGSVRDVTKVPCVYSRVVPFYRRVDRGTASDSVGKRRLCPKYSWGPFTQGTGYIASGDVTQKALAGRGLRRQRSVSLRPEGPGEGCTSQALEGTWGWALSITSHLDGSPCRSRPL